MKSKRQKVKTSNCQNDDRPRDAADLDVLTFGRLDICSSPDFTRRVMGRLGFMRVSAKAARRDRIRRWTNRAGVLLALAISIGAAQRFYEGSEQVRRPESLTIPAAVGNDMRQQQHRFENVIRTIRSVVPAQPHLAPMTAPQQDQREEHPRPLEGDFDQPQTSPFRWV